MGPNPTFLIRRIIRSNPNLIWRPEPPRGKWKHLSTWKEKETKRDFPKVPASEMEIARVYVTYDIAE